MNSTTPAPGVQNISEAVQCYNCGSNGHFFNACPEPTRNPPFGLAAAQAKGTAGVQGQHQQAAFKRQKTGNGPVVTRYPVPGPVITKYPAPPQGMPFHGTHGPQSQWGPQYPVQPLADTQNFQQPHVSYGPQGYAPQPHYGQYGQYPPSGLQIQPQPYGGGILPQQQPGYPPNASPQAPYGYGIHQPYYQQQPHFHGNSYNTVAVDQYAQSHPSLQFQHNPPYLSSQASYQHAPPYPVPNYQPGFNAMDPSHSSHGFPPPQTQQYTTGAQPYYSYAQNQPAPPGYCAPQSQPFLAHFQQHPAQPPQHWQQAYTQMPPHRVASSEADSSGNGARPPYGVSTGQTPRASSDVAALKPSEVVPGPVRVNTPNKSVAAEEASAGKEGSVRPPFKATPIIDPFDMEWEESIKDYKYSPSVQAVAISTPITLKHEEFPTLSTSGWIGIMSKYVDPENMEDFILPIEESIHWSSLKDDPVFSEIDESLPLIAEIEWVEYSNARKAHYASLGTQSPEVPRRTVGNVSPGDHNHGAVDVGHRRSRANSLQETISTPRSSRSGSRTPNLKNQDTPNASDVDGKDDTWAPRRSESRHITPELDDQQEALLTSLGVSGAPRPISLGVIDIAGTPKSMRVVPGAPSRQDSGYLSGRPSISVSSGQDSNAARSGDPRRGSWSAQNPPPPPPPPSGRRPRGYGDYGSRGHSPAYGSNHSHTTSRNQSRSTSSNRTPDESPLSPTSAALLGHIPMEGEMNGRKRRQGDDHYMRRRPQPRVDEAFSRRW